MATGNYAVCVGKYIGEFVLNAQKFNAMMNGGVPYEEAFEACRNIPMKDRIGRYNTSYRLYSYEVDGVTYVRADTKAAHRKDKYIYMNEIKGKEVKVFFDPNNHGVSMAGETLTPETLENKLALRSMIFGIVSLATMILGVPGIVFCVLSIIDGIRALKGKCTKFYLALAGLILSGAGIIFLGFLALAIVATGFAYLY